ncbi:hypothetical protein HanRHA438_Chr02g0060251 [Helianthus annuus]|nr:hypothetical protein HanRHA438_Chr02g0060251 [Helianthus annuus]
MLTDSELLQHLHDILRTSNLDTATGATVHRILEDKLGVDLSDKKPYIGQQIDLYLQSRYTNGNTDECGEELENVKVEESDTGGSCDEEGEDEPDEEDSDVDDKKVNSSGKPSALQPSKKHNTKNVVGGSVAAYLYHLWVVAADGDGGTTLRWN